MAATTRVGLVQLRSGTDPAANLAAVSAFAGAAAAAGANYVLTPEMSVAFVRDREELGRVAPPFAGNRFVAELAALANQLGIFLHVGSMAFALEDGRFANRSLLFSPDGALLARYDKIHLFDADPPGDRPYRESETYRGGDRAVVARAGALRLGLSVCYDLRFPALYAGLAAAGAEVMTVPAAFTVPTGAAHWHVLLRARAIETGSFVLAAAQGGAHENGRKTYGHSLVVDPWGRIVAEKPDDTDGVLLAELDLDLVADARRRLPALANRRDFSLSVNEDGPE
ncbi:MAG: carbon-nitrogen hydrolase family protein [Alphaproteobacteria bacterium]|nr:carbon-nitrogen hydrolase family protein [Alphaproteobacteria bacterium]